jgi:hypothetical protein
LTDYNKKAIMPFHMATQKSNMKNKNINTLAPLNKPLIGYNSSLNKTNFSTNSTTTTFRINGNILFSL